MFSYFLVQVNPPHLVPLVELVPAPWTDPDVIQTTKNLMIDIGQSPVVAKKEVNGFILNRLQYALLMEAWRLVEVDLLLLLLLLLQLLCDIYLLDTAIQAPFTR